MISAELAPSDVSSSWHRPVTNDPPTIDSSLHYDVSDKVTQLNINLLTLNADISANRATNKATLGRIASTFDDLNRI